MSTVLKTIKRMPVGVYPLMAVLGVAVGGCSYFCVRTLFNADNTWVRSKPHHWESIKQNQTTKFYDPSGHFTERWSRKGI